VTEALEEHLKWTREMFPKQSASGCTNTHYA
jgi:hypothetical protein